MTERVYAVRAHMVDGGNVDLLMFAREEEAMQFRTTFGLPLGVESVEVVTRYVIGVRRPGIAAMLIALLSVGCSSPVAPAYVPHAVLQNAVAPTISSSGEVTGRVINSGPDCAGRVAIEVGITIGNILKTLNTQGPTFMQPGQTADFRVCCLRGASSVTVYYGSTPVSCK